jgi:hypothetical protein
MGFIGRAGPCLSARFCASLQCNGECGFNLLGIPAGHLKGRAGFIFLNVKTRWPSPQPFGNGLANLSKTAGAEVRMGQGLIPAHRREPAGLFENGASIDGASPSLRSLTAAPVWFEPRKDPKAAAQPLPGGRLSRRRPARFASREVHWRDGWSQPGGSRLQREASRQTGKSLQWIERQSRSPSPN